MPPNANEGENQVSSPRKSLEQEYLDYETKVRTGPLVIFFSLLFLVTKYDFVTKSSDHYNLQHCG